MLFLKQYAHPLTIVCDILTNWSSSCAYNIVPYNIVSAWWRPIGQNVVHYCYRMCICIHILYLCQNTWVQKSSPMFIVIIIGSCFFEKELWKLVNVFATKIVNINLWIFLCKKLWAVLHVFFAKKSWTLVHGFFAKKL